MRTILKPRAPGIFLSLLLLSSGAIQNSICAQLPADVTFNQDAGGRSLLFVTLRLQNGEALPFLVDTGSEGTIFDKSLEPKLGKRLGTGVMWNFGVKHKSGIYATPKLYLGSTLLETSGNIWTTDFKQMSSRHGRPVMGILGMDCLRYYCIQLDFEAGKMRFLTRDQVDAAKLGEAFPMRLTGLGSSAGENMRPFIYVGSLIGGEGTNLLVDTGYSCDGALESGLFRRRVLDHRLPIEGDVTICQGSAFAWFQKCVWNANTYTNLLIGNGGTDFSTGNGGNLIGLGFLARHLVTFDFPARTLYLKQTRIGPLADEAMEAATEFVNTLKGNGQLPGWSTNDKGAIYCHADINLDAFDARKDGDSSTYHYIVARAAKDSPWKLRKAWRTDQKDHIIQNYRVP